MLELVTRVSILYYIIGFAIDNIGVKIIGDNQPNFVVVELSALKTDEIFRFSTVISW